MHRAACASLALDLVQSPYKDGYQVSLAEPGARGPRPTTEGRRQPCPTRYLGEHSEDEVEPDCLNHCHVVEKRVLTRQGTKCASVYR